MCRVLGVSRAGFYAFERRAPCDRVLSDAWLTREIRRVHAASRGLYGSPRIHAELCEDGVRVARKRVERLMRCAGLEGAHLRRRAATTVRVPGIVPADDLVCRDFAALGPNQLWVADLKEVATGEGKLYLACVTDCFSRSVVGWAMADREKQSVTQAM